MSQFFLTFYLRKKMKVKYKILSVVLSFSIFFSSCTLHPKYQRDHTPELSEWKVSLEPNSNVESTISFWTLFNDPVLNQLVEEALNHNQEIKVAIENVNIYMAKLGVARSKLFPDLNASIGGMREKQPSSTFNTPLYLGNVFDLVFSTSYLIDLWGEVRSRAEGAYHRLMASVEERKGVVLSIVSMTMMTYFLLRQYDRQLEISLMTIEDRNRSYDLACIRFELGLTSLLQVEQAKAELEFANLEAERLQIAIGESEDLISVLIGSPTKQIPRGVAIEQFKMPKEVLETIPSKILDQRPDLKKKEQLLIAANADIGVAKAKFFPQLNFAASYGFLSQTLPTLLQNYSSLWGYGLNILQEIFTGGRLTSDLKMTQAEKRKALYDY
ncbi:MAG: efflux transporter outer membrane subunit, partial [Chlamydiae bacterium]|nr:efflux transporter outer membrane subunit [Chlamydiota bacterium]